MLWFLGLIGYIVGLIYAKFYDCTVTLSKDMLNRMNIPPVTHGTLHTGHFELPNVKSFVDNNCSFCVSSIHFHRIYDIFSHIQTATSKV